MTDIKESDWKTFRKLHPIALNRFCQRVLEDTNRIIANQDQTAHEKYLAIYKLIHDSDKEIQQTFDDLRRSTAILKLAIMLRLGLITKDELRRFSDETQDLLNRMRNWS